jgi:hypothetical protein
MVVLLLLQQQTGATENTEARHQEPSGKQRKAPRCGSLQSASRKRVCAAASSPPICRESTDSPEIVRFATDATPRAGTARVP